MLNQYFQDIHKTHKAGDATEPSYYSDLKKLLDSFLKSKGFDSNITIQSKKTKAGIPDLTIRKGKQLIGYVEAKDLENEELGVIEDSEQIERYKQKLPNFIFTNYFDFWLWRRDAVDESKGKWIKKVKIGQPRLLKLNNVPPYQNEKDFFELLEAFFSFYIPERKTAKSLAKELASRAALIPSQISYLLNDEKAEEIDRIYEAFKEYLIANLSKNDFADIYAQTIVYGLFSARLKQKNRDEFDRFIAERLIPKNIKILHDTFSLISSNALPEAAAVYVDDIATVLAYADIEKIREELHFKKGGDDPLMHFYETFLKEYDPKKRKARGVYYTPFPVVSFITRSINNLLKEKFGKKYGFASDGVTILDPASGTLTFPSNAISIAHDEIKKSPKAGAWTQIVKDHILKNFYAFELLMAPYIIGHLKISLLLEELGYKFGIDEKFNLYLTNTLDFKEHVTSTLPGFPHALTEESEKALKIKKETPILVIMGNPPYSVSSANIIKEDSDYKKLYESYKENVRKQERNIQPLSDDYIKFIAFAHWKIKQAGQGIVGMITNNSYLDGLIHRDMRCKLAEDFDEIYILNLHGNLKRQEKTPKGGKDENVFDIQQGVCIILMIKSEEVKKEIKYIDLYGLREEKYKFLEAHDIKSIKLQDLELKEPNYYFVFKDMKGEKGYSRFTPLVSIFSEFSSGVKTHRDGFVLDNSKDKLERKLMMFSNKKLDDQTLISAFDLKDTGTWKIRKAREEFTKNEIKDELFRKYSYRLFDTQWIYYDKNLIERSRDENIWKMDENNLALITSKQLSTFPFKHGFVSQFAPDICLLSLQTKESAYVFPLYLHEEKHYVISSGQEKLDLAGVQHTLRRKSNKKPNINQDFYSKLEKDFGKQVEPEKIFNYIYAVLYSNIYRKKYNEFLKIDFPRIPFTKDDKLFYKITEIGKKLVDLHLLKSEKLENSNTTFPVVGDSVVTKRYYDEKQKRLYINDNQYFGMITPQVWNYYIGGYQVLDKWLRDRVGKSLLSLDVEHFLKVITSLYYTIDLQKEIDKLYPEIEKSL